MSETNNAEETAPSEFTEKDLPNGFRFAGLAAGIKSSGKPDLALIAGESWQKLTAAGVYTQNLIRAASIDWNRNITPSDSVAGLVINSGNANACTGELGRQNNEAFAQIIGDQLQTTPDEILVLSTGVIGEQLPMTSITSHAASLHDSLKNDLSSFQDAAEGILTTDRGPKIASSRISLGLSEVAIAGMCKGAGMIGPRMATMLGVITTDVDLTAAQAQKFLENAVNLSFNCISVDGHMSTNDAVILLTSKKTHIDWNVELEETFQSTLTDLCVRLAKQIPDDGEGSEHLVEIRVAGTATDEDADKIARCIASSNLVKTAISGCDPNWGRIVSAAGYANVDFDPSQVSLRLNGFSVFATGSPMGFDELEVSSSIKNSRETIVELSVGAGGGSARHWTSDLTYEYVRINSEYRT